VSAAEPRAGQEAARLLAAAQDWLRTSAPHLAPLADDGAPCSCPVCRAVAGLREADPDSVGRWVDSAVTALGSLVSQAGDLASSRAQRDDEVPGDDGPDAGETDTVDGPDEHVGEDDPRAGGAGQDGSRPRRVRRIPLDLRVEDTGGQDR
jgi:hypothetical protein